MGAFSADRSPGTKLAFAMLVGLLLTIPLFSVWLLVYDRQSQSETARASIAEGWGGPQRIAGPLLVIPYRTTATETVTENNRPVVHSSTVWHELTLAPDTVRMATAINSKTRQRSIYEVVVYEAQLKGQSQFSLPANFSDSGVALPDMALDRAQLRFGLSDPRGLYGPPPHVNVGGHALNLQPGGGLPATGRSGFFAKVDAKALAGGPLSVGYDYAFRGNGQLSLIPQAGDTQWTVQSSWQSPSFQGGFLPGFRHVTNKGFKAVYRVGNLALGQSLVSTDIGGSTGSERETVEPYPPVRGTSLATQAASDTEARIDLVQPVDLYSRVNRSVKYGFLFIGFTFVAFLLFDVIGGVPVSAVEYLLVGAALVLFFVLLLAFAEVIGFTFAYLAASAAIIGLNAAYSAAVLKSWRRALLIGGLLTGLYAVLYVLLSLEDFSLLIGSVMLFVALAAVMYLTRNLNWGGHSEPQPAIE